MERIATPDVAADLHGAGKDGFKDGLPPSGISTALDSAWFNALQEEIASYIEAEGITLVPGTFTQLRSAVQRAEKTKRLSDVVFNSHRRTSTLAAVTGVGCASQPPLKTVSGVPTPRGVVAVCGNNFFFLSKEWGENLVSQGGVVSTLNDCAARADPDTTGDGMAVGDAGKWNYHSSTFTNDSGTVSGTPDLDAVIWDQVNALWWAVGPGGIYKTVNEIIAWVQVSATAHKGAAVNPAGRVMFYRPADDIIYYTDDNSTLNAGVDLTASLGSVALGSMEYDGDAGGVILAYSGGLFNIGDGTSVVADASLFPSEPRILLLDGRVFATVSDGMIMRVTPELSTTITDYRTGQASIDPFEAVGGSAEFFAWYANGELYFSHIIPDLNGA